MVEKKKYVGPGKPPSEEEKKDKTKQEELKQIKIEKQELADEKKEFNKKRDNWEQKFDKGDEAMELKEMEGEIKGLKGSVENLVGTVGEIVGVEKERQRQEADRKSKEEEDKRLKSIVEPLKIGLEGVKQAQDKQPKIHCATDGVCFTDSGKRDEYETELQQKKKKESVPVKDKKRDESKAPGVFVVSEEDKKLFGELGDMRDYYKGLTGEEAKRPVTIVAELAKQALGKIAESDAKAASDIAERFIPKKVVEEIKKGLTDVNSINTEDKAKLFVQECQGPNAPAFCKILQKEGFKVQQEKKGSMPGSSGWKDIA